MIHLCVIWRIGAAGQYPRGGFEPWRIPQSSCAWDCLGFSTEVLQPRKHLSLRQTGMACQPTLLSPEGHHTVLIMSLAPTSSMVLCTIWMKLWKMTWFPNLWMTQNCKKLLTRWFKSGQAMLEETGTQAEAQCSLLYTLLPPPSRGWRRDKMVCFFPNLGSVLQLTSFTFKYPSLF